MSASKNTQNINPLAGKPAPKSILIDVQKLIAAYYNEIPDPSIPKERVKFGTSGHRGSAFEKTFNEKHILAISQAICFFRQQQNITGPLFLGMDTHALSKPAFESALEVFAANDVDVMISSTSPYTPTPVISNAILNYNRKKLRGPEDWQKFINNNINQNGLADGVVITPSHDPPHDGGFKYNPPSGGPADLEITNWIENKANEFLENDLLGVKRIPFDRAVKSGTTHAHDYLNPYVEDLQHVLDMDLIRASGLSLGVDPLGGAGVDYWEPIAERYKLNLNIVNKTVDPRFSFMTVDWDGQIRMDPSSPYAMQKLVAIKDKFDIAFACDTDHDRHGIVTRSSGLLPPNHYLSAAIFYLFQHRPNWDLEKVGAHSAFIGKTMVSSVMIDRVAKSLGQQVYEVPVGFKWFVPGLLSGNLKFGGEESAGASFSRLSGSVWTTDKDGIIAALLSAEITAANGKDPGQIYQQLEETLGKTFYDRVDNATNDEQKNILKHLSKKDINSTQLAGDPIQAILNTAPGNKAPIGGLKIITEKGWFAARPSGTENIYRIYAESLVSREHLNNIMTEAKAIIAEAFKQK